MTEKEKPPSHEDFIEVTGGKVWYKIVGVQSKGLPLLTLHGGPGGSSGTLIALEALADERPVIFYDQLGAGNSERPDDDSLWTLDRFIEEVDKVRNSLNLERFHLLGHSWGSLLAAKYATRQSRGVQSIFLSGPFLSVPRWLTDTNKLKQQLPEEIRETIERNEREGTTNSEEYKKASEEFDRRHYCLIHPYPEVVQNTKKVANNKIYEIMWGPSEFSCTGNLAGYDVTGELGEITVPVFLS
ncbi:proline iminopeptidase, partial [Candidatus Curtissbacteria bacterium RBG_13_40_7]